MLALCAANPPTENVSLATIQQVGFDRDEALLVRHEIGEVSGPRRVVAIAVVRVGDVVVTVRAESPDASYVQELATVAANRLR